MRFSSAANRPNDGGPWPDRRHRRSRTLPRLRDACVVAGCFGLMSVQLFSSVTLMGLKQVVEEAARPGVSRRSSSSAKSIVGGATSRQMSAELDGPTAPQGGALPRHKKPSFRGQLDAKARQDEAGDREAPQEGAKPTAAAAAAEPEDGDVASSPTSMITSIQWPEMQHLERPKEQFKRYDNVVVATKVFGPEKVEEMKQMFCLFMAAYNRHVNYDIVMFTTLPWEDEQVQELRKVVGPSVNLTVVLEAKPLLEQVAEMSPEDRDYLYRRCRVPWDGQISYYHWCLEEPNTTDKPFFDVRLSYAWQAEFRARHVWHMPVLEKYKYMLWIDSDAFCTKPWDVDPVQVAVENDLVILFDNFPGDTADNPVLKDKMVRAYNRSLCELYLEDGHFKGRDCDEEELSKPGYWLKIVHGFFKVKCNKVGATVISRSRVVTHSSERP
jgi:hypothetical protein